MKINYTLTNKLHSINTKIDLISAKSKSILNDSELTELILQRDNIRSILKQSDYQIRKSTGGYSIDKKEFGFCTFIIQCKTKKEAENYIADACQSSKQSTLNLK